MLEAAQLKKKIQDLLKSADVDSADVSEDEIDRRRSGKGHKRVTVRRRYSTLYLLSHEESFTHKCLMEHFTLQNLQSCGREYELSHLT